MRPDRAVVKAYTHKTVFKSLEEIVHFYNKRNIAVNGCGDEVVFDLRVGPPAGYTRLIAPPEVLDNVQNVAGFSPADAGSEVSNNGRVGNLVRTPGEERDLVNFLKTLTDGYTGPNPVEDDCPRNTNLENQHTPNYDTREEHFNPPAKDLKHHGDSPGCVVIRKSKGQTS